MHIYPSQRGKIVSNSNLQNVESYNIWLNRLLVLDSTLYKWYNLPDTMDERTIELTLSYRGYCLFFKDDIMDAHLSLPVNLADRWNIYGVPYYRYAYSVNNGYYNTLTPYNSVIVRNDILNTSHYPALMQFARRLSEIDRSIDVNVKSQKTPILIRTPKEQELTMINMYKQYDENTPLIIGSDLLSDMTGFEVLKTDAPFVADKLTILGHNILSDALSYMGYDNSQSDKKERLIVDEVHGNDGQIVAQRTAGLVYRQKAADDYNTLYGLNISVDVNPDMTVAYNQIMQSHYNYNTLDSPSIDLGGGNSEV